MSYCREEGSEGKDKVIFLTKEDYDKPSTAALAEDEEEPGLILDNGDINWSCPCLGGMATGPCGVEFREAFSCFHYSEEEMKGSDCFDQFRKMQECMAQYPDLYDNDKDEEQNKNMPDDNDMSSVITDNQQENDIGTTEKTVAS